MLVVINILGTSGKPRRKQQRPSTLTTNPYHCLECGTHLAEYFEYCPLCGKPIAKRKRGRPRKH